MKDDNFLRLIYEVGAYRKRMHDLMKSEAEVKGEPEQFGTILSLSDDPARSRLYKPYFAWEVTPGRDDAERARQLEIFLDAVAMYASSDYSWLLDGRYSYLLSDRERELVGAVRLLAGDVEELGHASEPWAALHGSLQHFGVRPIPGGATVRPERRQLPANLKEHEEEGAR